MAAFLGDGDDDTLETAFRAWNFCYQQAAMIVHVIELLEMAKISSNNIFANRLVFYRFILIPSIFKQILVHFPIKASLYFRIN